MTMRKSKSMDGHPIHWEKGVVQVTRKPIRIFLLVLSMVLACSAIVYAATFYADLEWPHYIYGEATLTIGANDEGIASAKTTTWALGIAYDPFRVHCQLWENGHYLTSDTDNYPTFGQYYELELNDFSSGPKYDGDYWVYAVHYAEGNSYVNDIQSSGYVSVSKRSGIDIVAWNAPSMAIAESLSPYDATIVPWHKLDTLKTVLGGQKGERFMWTVIEAVVPRLERGDMMPAVAIDSEAAAAVVFVPKEKGGHIEIRLPFPDTDKTPMTDSI